MTVGLGLIGLGRLGRVRAEIAGRQLAAGRLVAVHDIDATLTSEVAGEYGCRPAHSLEELVDGADVDAVIVATPSALHVDPVAAVASAGKPLFCEKPLASNLADTIEVARSIDAAGIVCQMGFNRRSDPDHVDARARIEAGEIGAITYLRSQIRDPFPPPPWALDPTTGGGLFYDMLIHDIDAARMLTGSEITSVYAQTANLVIDNEGVESFRDNATVSATFAGGALGHFHGSVHARYGYDVRAEVFGADGCIEIGGLTRRNVTVMTEVGGIAQPSTFQTSGGVPHAMYRFADAYRNELQAFVAVVGDHAAPPADHHDAVAAFRVAAACQRSADEARPVAVDEIG